jgi:hypothetical protein
VCVELASPIVENTRLSCRGGVGPDHPGKGQDIGKLRSPMREDGYSPPHFRDLSCVGPSRGPLHAAGLMSILEEYTRHPPSPDLLEPLGL